MIKTEIGTDTVVLSQRALIVIIISKSKWVAKMADKSLKFPCDCVSGNADCEESWVKVAKDGMFKNGTKEIIINQLHERPLTIAQFAKHHNLAQPTVFRHISDLLKNGIIRVSTDVEKGYTAEKYYELNFPVITHKDQARFDSIIQDLSSDIEQMMKDRLNVLRDDYHQTEAFAKGWSFEEFAQYVVFSAQRKARKSLEKNGQLATELKGSGLDFMFWAEEK